MEFSLAHLSDPHLPLPQGAAQWRGLRPKQLLALLNWHRKRHRLHTWRPLPALLTDLAAHAPDHVALTGDLVNLAAPEEFAAGAQWLARLGPARDVSYVPGNHDLTAATPPAKGLGLWSAWMTGDDPGDVGFPFLRRRGELALIGMSSAIVTPVGSAAGALGAAQLGRSAELLDQARQVGLFRVVLIHHPPVMGPGGRRKALRDRAAFCAILGRHGAELVLHGHHHRTQLSYVPGPAGPIPVVGAPAALAGGPGEPAGWLLHRITRLAQGWRLTTTLRRHDPAANCFKTAGEWSI